ncbi:SDR family oxidoreductase [Actinobacteria bacterium YIM 96077]|uniref:Short-chain dehydrogenase n=1 Tax=Phytoactinopolyspora halophila TaxID=1981511 RepID=A0A329QEZ5_9ACTN|nr:SDR family oxidoreductase [Phytoactinopolyspora halophila]AYY11821.1 SDR family oxidoreductase [Actinobacteria bacterium YIM 96077]RAW09842.1 hypothetical protein DPM12_20065 [Phytoactinopolyspora halophila]
MRLDGKRAVVTGAASRGIGRAIVDAFRAEAADVAIIDIRSPMDPADTPMDEPADHGRPASSASPAPLMIKADVSDPDQLTGALRQARDEMGSIDVLVNAAAMAARKPFLELTLADWDQVHAVNLRPYFVATRWVGQLLVDRGAPGSIINVASITASIGVAGQAHYAAAKGGIVSLTRAAAVELAPHQIRVNSISPGTVESDFNRQLLADPEFRTMRTEPIPLGRVGQPREIAGVATLLASDEGSFITGTDIHVDGGQLAC